MKTTFTLWLFACLAGLSAQSYEFSLQQTEYTELEGGVSLNGEEVWDDPDYAVPLGFTFPLFGSPYDTLFFAYEMGLGGDITNIDEEIADPAAPRHLIYAYINDLADRGYTDEQETLSPITYHLTGTAPNHIGIIQWKNAGFFDDIEEDGVSDHFVNFQLWLYEATGRIEVHYGPSSEAIQEPGVDGTAPGFALIKNLTSDGQDDNVYDEGYYLTGSPDAPEFRSVDELGDDDEPFLDAVPAPGTVYVFNVSESTGLRDVESLTSSFRVFPNPATEDVRMAMAPDFAGRVDRLEVYDATGRRLAVYPGLPATVSMTDLQAGVYHFRVTSEGGSSTLRRVIKQ